MLYKILRIHNTSVGCQIKKGIAVANFPGMGNGIQKKALVKIDSAEMKWRPGTFEDVLHPVRFHRHRHEFFTDIGPGLIDTRILAQSASIFAGLPPRIVGWPTGNPGKG